MADKKGEIEKNDEKDNQDSPMLDLNDTAVKKFIKDAKKKGFVTYDELNKILPSEEFTSEQIEDIMHSGWQWKRQRSATVSLATRFSWETAQGSEL